MSCGRSARWVVGRGLLALWFMLAAAGASAQGPPVPASPPDGLHDDSRVLSAPQRAAAVRAVASARAAGVDLYVAIYGFIMGETIENRAERLKEAWCPNGASLLVVADISTNQCTYLSHVSETEWLSTTELQRIFTESSAIAAATEGTESGDKILSVIENLAPRLSAAMEKHRELTRYRISPRAWRVFTAVALAALALLLLSALARWCFHRLRRAATPVPAYFPTVAVGERFGAAFGGGVIAEVSFGTQDQS